ncbi:MAG: AmmeMemoRadiSam system radical SAM enzyme [Candidatus Woesearchaeota archaeon]
MREALFYRKLKGKKVECQLCPRKCVIGPGKLGFCKARRNIGGKLFSLVYGMPAALHVDPVEKKPLFHFLPGSTALSLGTTGCNFSCDNCQNFEISQSQPAEFEEVSPERIVELAVEHSCKSIAFTYNEPTVFYEYMLDIALLAKKKGVRCIIVSNGFINEAPLKKILPIIDAANIDLKGDANFYRRVAKGELDPVLNSLKLLRNAGVWLEITNLLIPGYNDSEKDIEWLSSWIERNLGRDVPLHISRFFPMFRMADVPITPESRIEEAYMTAKKHLDFVYTGNLFNGREDTICPNCSNCLVGRSGYFIRENNIERGKCKFCRRKIPGVWD